ncbi:hypothetical protein PF005_g16128 [Phytophthora fragariae]|uniref:CCD97-like C-terminal domain-containing protein n=2 Tax=Phytophthora TaxID=4783 RepID=A0A6A3RBP7_9STRA|nr:hypothetical protein PF003_g19254 [Phytophthora fragariae]KAE9019927.1 hypothetical protein PR002_g12664 [Phytophthora rubi]KAE8932701.1 hypothetical protein PF009_g17275 [Phytophthora fragariae]KAE8997959.1 hypothetical protein PF011_g15252 [Phytophthora fragariae]KAE9025502.1 hypothetical protein PR001_g12408 [Phytophthora rubi]
MSVEDVDSLDAYMASLELPSGDATTSMAQARAEHGTSRNAPRGHGVVVKNRRYRRLQQLMQGEGEVEDQYFSDAMMQQRSPALFHFYLGQYLAFEKGPTATTVTTAVDNGGQKLSSFLMDTCQRSEMEARRVAEQETWGAFTAADEKQEQRRLERLYEEDNVVEEEEEDDEQEEDQVDAAAFSVAERRQQLVEVMSARFLNGEDAEYVRYAEIDADESLDDFAEMQRDAEDQYFAD